ncbi:hypothetical protein THAOC_29591, partial [Thalassiosira oceanica]
MISTTPRTLLDSWMRFARGQPEDSQRTTALSDLSRGQRRLKPLLVLTCRRRRLPEDRGYDIGVQSEQAGSFPVHACSISPSGFGLQTGAKPAVRRPTDGFELGPGRDPPGNFHPLACPAAATVDGDPQPTNSHVNHHQPSSQASGYYVGCLRERGDKANDLKMTLDGVRKGVENDDGVDHDVGGGRGPEFEPSSRREKGDPVEGELGASRHPNTQQLRDMQARPEAERRGGCR